MAITRYRPPLARLDPWQELDAFRNRLASFFPMPAVTADVGNGFTWNPLMDITENDDALMLTAELPGMDEKDVDIEIENNVLTVRGEKKREHEETDERHHIWERSYGSFERSLALPRAVAADKITAKFDKGVLTVTMPKTKEAKGRKIMIEKK